MVPRKLSEDRRKAGSFLLRVASCQPVTSACWYKVRVTGTAVVPLSQRNLSVEKIVLIDARLRSSHRRLYSSARSTANRTLILPFEIIEVHSVDNDEAADVC